MLPAKLHTMQLTTSPKPIDLNSMIAVTFHRHYRDSRLAHFRIPESGESACSRKSLTSRSFVGCLERSRVDDFDGDSFAHQPPVVFESLLTFSRIQTEVRDRAETPSVAADGLVVFLSGSGFSSQLARLWWPLFSPRAHTPARND